MKKQRAFTLLELLVVMAILALLVGLGVRTFGSVQQKSRDGRRKQDLQSISKALELYYNDFKRYPASNADGKIMGCGAAAVQACIFGQLWKNTTDETLYMSELPQDPGGGQYFYLTNELGTNYQLFAYLENTEDAMIARNVDGNAAYYVGAACRLIDTVWQTNTCNYILMSTNLSIKPDIVDSY